MSLDTKGKSTAGKSAIGTSIKNDGQHALSSNLDASSPALSVHTLNIQLNKHSVLRDISFSIPSSSITAIIGANGAGKSTLLKALSAELPSAANSICYFNQALHTIPQALRAQTMAVLPQFSQLNFPFSAEEVISLGRIPHSSGAARDKEIICEVLEELDITHLRAQAYTQLSGGEKQRVQLARVLAQIWPESIQTRSAEQETEAEQSTNPNTSLQTRFLLLDEPTSALDIRHQHALMLSLKKLKHHNVSTIMIMHDFNLAAQYADRIIALKQGELRADGDAKTVFTEGNMRELFDINAQILEHPESLRPIIVV